VDPSLFATFDQVERSHWWFTARREIVLTVAERFLPPGAAILDVGCGTGYFLEAAALRYQAWGVDPSPLAVELCRARGLERVSQGSAYDLSAVAAQRFAAAFFLDVIEHLDEDARALREAIGVLAPGGRVIVTVPAFMFLWSEHDVVNQHRRRYRRPQLAALFRQVGLEIERLTYFNFYLFPLASADRLASRIGRRKVRAELSVPRPWVNRLMAGTFRSERGRVADPGRLAFPFGLSLLAVGRRGAG
jgi:SAM-dependent methyltransferase